MDTFLLALLIESAVFNGCGVLRVGYYKVMHLNRKIYNYKGDVSFCLCVAQNNGKWAGAVTRCHHSGSNYWGFAIPISRDDFTFNTPEEAIVAAKEVFLKRVKHESGLINAVIPIKFPDIANMDYGDFSEVSLL